MDRKAILITGSHRSGSTWVGKMVALSPLVAYIHEPFNVSRDPGRGFPKLKLDYWFTYVSPENETRFYEDIDSLINFRYKLTDALSGAKNKKDLVSSWREYKILLKCRFIKTRPLLKDPIAIFAAEWLAASFKTQNIVLIRHPAAFASSLKLKNWTFPFQHFLQQPLLMEAYLSPFATEIKSYVEQERDIIDQASLLWKIIHYVILQYRQKYPSWLFIRHEDLSREPLTGFEEIFNYLELPYTEAIRDAIREYSSADNPREGEKNATHTLKRDSKGNIWNWKTRLAPSEIDRIRSRVEEISAHFYTEAEW